MSTPVLNELDRQSATWLKIREHYDLRLASLRRLNDNSKSIEATEKLRGQIHECKLVLAMGDPSPAPVASDEEQP